MGTSCKKVDAVGSGRWRDANGRMRQCRRVTREADTGNADTKLSTTELIDGGTGGRLVAGVKPGNTGANTLSANLWSLSFISSD
jgi:hypothetical protein